MADYMDMKQFADTLKQMRQTFGEEKENMGRRPRIASMGQAGLLKVALARLQDDHEFVVGTLVTLKNELQSSYKTHEGEIYIVSGNIDPPHLLTDAQLYGTPPYLRRDDIKVMCIGEDGKATEYAADSRYFEPYTGEVA